MAAPPALSYRFILRFWSPLAMTWFLMALEGPIVAAFIARMAEAKVNLAAYGIAFAFALVFEAPVIMLLTAATALVKDGPSYRKLLLFTKMLGAAVVAVHLLVLWPAVFNRLAVLLAWPAPLAELTYATLACLLPWPMAIGFRRFFQGVLIAQGQTRRFVYGTAVRLTAMGATALALMFCTVWPGAVIGGLALSVGVVAEAIVVYLMTLQAIRLVCASSHKDSDEEPLGLRRFWHFYFPLALTSFIALAVQPMVSFFVGACSYPLESLAVLPVINAFLFVFRCVGLSFQEVAIALVGKNFAGYRPLRNFALVLALILSGVLALIAFTPISFFWFGEVSGLGDSLAQFSILPLQVMVAMPGLTIFVCWQRSMAIQMKRPMLVTRATAVEVATIVAVMLTAAHNSSIHGALAAALAITLGRLVSCAYLAMNRSAIVPILQRPIPSPALPSSP